MASFEQKLEILYRYPEMLDFIELIIEGTPKHGEDNWLELDGKTMAVHKNADSMFHHLCEYRSGEDKSPQSNFPPELSIMCRAGMAYVRRQRGIVHTDDLERLRHKIFTSGATDEY